VKSASGLYRLLGDEARLRILRLLGQERLNVTELTGILDIAQSGVSRHLGLLEQARLVSEARDGGFTYYRVADQARESPLWGVLDDQFRESAHDPAVRADEARLREVLRLRKENFDTHGTDARQLVPGRSWAAWARALGHLLAPVRVADIGCGEGYLTIEAARWAERVIAIDRSAHVLRRARELAKRRRVTNIVWKRGEIECLPLERGAVDVALLSQALHHAGRPERALAEAARIVVPGGCVLVLDLRAHDQAWVRDRFGDKWLGFEDEALERMMAAAGLADVKVGVGARLTGDPFTVLVASGRKPTGTRTDKPRRPQRSRRLLASL
jgi:ArsR family transcriptional regulator